MEQIAECSPQFMARMAGAFYVLNIVTSLAAFSGKHALAAAFGHVATICYVVVTALFYYIFKPVDRNISLLAALFSLTGCVNGALSSFHLPHFRISSLVFFGFYCLLIGYLIFKSSFLPHILGALMVIAGLSWLTFLSPQLGKTLSPYNYFPGAIGEGLLTLWMLVMGLTSERWKAQAAAGRLRG